MSQPIVVSYGVGRDSTAMLIEMHRRGIRPDAILFANVGSEKRQTYQYIPIMNQWLKDHDFPAITIVQYRPKHAPYRSLEGNMILNATLPGATFNRGSCTMKFKIVPQTRWTEQWEPAQRAWASGQKVIKLIGFECAEEHRLRRADAKAHAGKGDPRERQRFEFHYPLMDWGYDLARCCDLIESVGLPVPVKSACFFCPNQKPEEVENLSPEDRARIILMELVAEPYNRKVRGLWRRRRKCDGRPGSITEYILQHRLPFTPLTCMGKKVVLNPKCQKAKNGGEFTFAGPHMGLTLRKLLDEAGHDVPEVVLPGSDAGGGADWWEEERRGPEPDAGERACTGCSDIDLETDQHLELVECL